MAYAVALFVFMSACSLGLSLTRGKKQEKVDVLQRLGQAAEQPGATVREVELKKPFAERALKPILAGIASLITLLMPAQIRNSLEPKLQQAGRPGNLTAGEFLALRVSIALVLGLVPLLLHGGFLLAVVLAALGWVLPGLYLNNRISQRMREIEKDLPNVLDLLTVSVEAGMGFDGAMGKVVEKSSGVLAEEFERVLRENSMGKSRKEALKDMANRLNDENITTFVGAIVQADQLGIRFGQVLRVQSDQVRLKKKQKVEEAAMKTPIKVLFPLVFFIFPTIFIVLLGPAAIKIASTLF